MKDYKKASEASQDMIFSYLKERQQEKKVSDKRLAEILQISIPTLWRYYNKKTPMPLSVYLEICGILEIRPYLIPKESDTTEMHRMFFN